MTQPPPENTNAVNMIRACFWPEDLPRLRHRVKLMSDFGRLLPQDKRQERLALIRGIQYINNAIILIEHFNAR